MWKNLYIHSIRKGNFFCQAGKLFSPEIWKVKKCHVWADVIVRQPRFRASRASPVQQSRGLRLALFQNFFKGYIVCFMDHSVGRYVFELFARETNLKKKRSVMLCTQIVFLFLFWHSEHNMYWACNFHLLNS